MGDITDFELTERINLAFWITFGASAIIGLGIMMLQGVSLARAGQLATGFEVTSVAVIFLILSIFTFLVILYAIIDDRDIFDAPLLIGQDTGQELALVFYLGFGLWYGLQSFKISGVTGSLASIIPTLPTVSLLSTGGDGAGTGLTMAQKFFLNGLMAPWVEETFFLIAIPIVLLTVWYFFDYRNALIELFLITVVPAVLFASFHVDQPALSSFWVAAFSFRAILQGLVYLDVTRDVLPGIALLGSFVLGAHTANNIFQLGGVVEFFTVLSGDTVLFVVGVVPFVIYGFWAVQAIVFWGDY